MVTYKPLSHYSELTLKNPPFLGHFTSLYTHVNMKPVTAGFHEISNANEVTSLKNMFKILFLTFFKTLKKMYI